VGRRRARAGQVVARGGFVERQGHALAAQQAQVGARVQRALHHGAGGVATAQVHRQGVEGGGVQRREAQLLEACRQDGGEARHALGDALESFGAVVHGVHAGDDGGQHLRGADVGGGLFAADVLLARLQRQAVGGLAVHVHAHAHQAAGHGALEFVAAGHVGGVRAARAHGHAKALRGADHDVGAHLARGLEQRERQQVGGQDQRGALGVDDVGAHLPVGQPAAGAGVLVDGGKVVVLADGGHPFVARADHLDRQMPSGAARVWMTSMVCGWQSPLTIRYCPWP
jgi:hypothetical protein